MRLTDRIKKHKNTPVSLQTAPSPAGRSPQRGRVGEGVSGVVYEQMATFFTFAALTPTPLSLREQCLPQRERGLFNELSTA